MKFSPTECSIFTHLIWVLWAYCSSVGGSVKTDGIFRRASGAEAVVMVTGSSEAFTSGLCQSNGESCTDESTGFGIVHLEFFSIMGSEPFDGGCGLCALNAVYGED